MLGTATPAWGALRFAEPAGDGPAATCPQADPCDLDTAVENGAVIDDDEIVVTPGTYNVTDLVVSDAVDLHGQALQPRPTINTTGGTGINLADSATVRDLTIEATGLVAIAASFGNPTIERVSAHATAGGGSACTAHTSVTIRDTICRQSGTNSRGVGANLSTFPGTTTVRLRNVTAVGSASGIGLTYSGDQVVLEADARGVIADGGTADVLAAASSGASTQITLDHSNYATEFETTGGTGVSATVTDPGTGTNQTAAPLFVNAGAGDFHQQAGSPTIDAGAVDAFSGPTDIDGDARTLEGDGVCPTAPDIGADELIGSGPIDCDPPETSIVGGPAGATADPTPTFDLVSDEPGSSFECRVDGAAFAGCASPHTTAPLADGSHALEVRATDTAGNTDATPAARPFAIDASAPETTITDAPKRKVKTRRKRAKLTFEFTADEAATFACALDDEPFAACSSPLTRKVRKGRHTFAVRAIDEAGNPDGSPDTASFRVKRKRPK
jgi:hypothetical protein